MIHIPRTKKFSYLDENFSSPASVEADVLFVLAQGKEERKKIAKTKTEGKRGKGGKNLNDKSMQGWNESKKEYSAEWIIKKQQRHIRIKKILKGVIEKGFTDTKRTKSRLDRSIIG